MTTTTPSSNPLVASPADGRAAGVILAIASVLSVMVLAHHPHVSATLPADIVAGIGARGAAARAVHGAVIVLLAAILVALVDASRVLGLRHLVVRAALLSAALGTGAMIGAALLDGFVLPELAARYVGAPAIALDTFLHLAVLCGIGVQVLTMFGFVAACLAIVLWSLRLLRTSPLGIAVGAFGLLVGPGLMVALATSVLQLRASDLGWIMAGESAWNLGLAVVLLRR